MDSGTKIKRHKNPKENASLLNKLFFFFALKTIRKGYRHDFQEDDIYEVMKDYRSERLGKRIDGLWKVELRKSNPSITRCLLKMFGIEYMLLGFGFFTFETATLIIQPVLTGKLVSYFEPNTQVTQEQAIWYAAGVLVCIFSFAFLDQTYWLLLSQVCLKVKISLSALVYRKSLKLNLYNTPQFASGNAVTLMTKDIMQFDTPLDCGHMFFNGFLQLIIMTTLMYRQIGVSALVGTAFLFILIPTQVYLGHLTSAFRLKTASQTDQRVRFTQEILTAIRIIKMYTWELFFSKIVNKLRRNELKYLRILFLLKAIALSVGQLSSRVAFYLCVMAYIALGNHITAEKAFFITGSFSAINILFNVYIPSGIGQIAELRAAFSRLTSFLLLDEVPLDVNTVETKSTLPHVLIENVTIKSNQRLIVDNLNLEMHDGLTILTGSTGSGKSTILKLILGDTKIEKGKINICGSVSYASQEPWLFPGSIKQNILFGVEYDQERYDEVIEVCALNKDFENLPNGDQTILTDKGLNLSRGQKTRINLARAVYRKSDIYLFDDCFSAVDALVMNHIFSKCIKRFLFNKICLLVSNQNALLNKADMIIVLHEGGIQFTGTYENLQKWDNDQFKKSYEIDRTIDNVNTMETVKCDNLVNTLDETNKPINIYSEESKTGSVKKEIFFQYLKQGGGIKMLILLLVFSIASQVASSWADYFVSFWVDMEQDLSGYYV